MAHMANPLSRAVAPIAIGVCLLSTLSFAAPPRYTWQRVGSVDNSEPSYPLALAEDGSGLVVHNRPGADSGGYPHGFAHFDSSGQIDWRYTTTAWWHDDFHVTSGSANGVVAGAQYHYPGTPPYNYDVVPTYYTPALGFQPLPALPAGRTSFGAGIDATGRYAWAQAYDLNYESAGVIWDIQAQTTAFTPGFWPSGVNRFGDASGVLPVMIGNGLITYPAVRKRDGTIWTVPLPEGATGFGGASQIDDAGRVLLFANLGNAGMGVYIVDGSDLHPIMEWDDVAGMEFSVDSYNSSNAAVGYVADHSLNTFVPTLWSDGQAYDLRDLVDDWDPAYGWGRPVAINDSGQILVGVGAMSPLPGYTPIDNTPAGYSFLLTPIPEPTSSAVLGLLLAGAAICRVR
jgi:hypothetical protein